MTQSDPHRGVALGLRDLGERMLIDDDGPHVAFVVGVMPDGRPMMWIACRSGRSDPITRYRTREESSSDPGGGEPAPWTLADLIAADRYLSSIRMHSRTSDLPTAHAMALRDVDRIRDHEIDQALRRAAFESSHPHICECSRRFTTARGLAVHKRSCGGMRRYRSSLGPLGERGDA